MNDRTAMGIGHWAFTQKNPDGPSMGIWEGKGKVRARVVQAAAGLLLCRIRRADKEVSCISSPYWRLLLPVKWLPHLSRLPFHGTPHTVCPHRGGNLHIERCVCIVRQWDDIGTRYTVHGTRYRHAPSWAEQSERTPRLGSSEMGKTALSLAAQVDTLDGARQWQAYGT